ncbi:hypothetical protein N288_22865 [Bacillus infantis NRRL B-14911]|uniref:Uncharacterized protein n=1 Tax=Bacillus infantis NRRL B-14911 TaxID=1367477 RepID=U5LIF8_9BACI|nr:hypothetical protein N288_22865 [Bacillus infantis NRRL B-14911]
MYFTFITLILHAFLIFFILAITLPFAAQPVHNLSPNLYINLFRYHVKLFAISTSLIIAFPLTHLTIRKNVNSKRKMIIFLVQSLSLLFLVLIYFLNRNYLNDLMIRPNFE